MKKKILIVILVLLLTLLTGFVVKTLTQPEPSTLVMTEHDGYIEIRGQ